MNKICVSAGLVALGAVTAHAQYAPGLSSMETTKPWAISATLRGFYDDNYLTLPKTVPETLPNGSVTYVQGARSSFGVEVSPSLSYNRSLADTLLSATYTYDMRWYQDQGTTDQTHEFNAKLAHEFSERYKLQLNESFVSAQEPEVLDPSVITEPLRIAGNNIRNTGSMDFTAQMTKLFDLHVGYVNTLYAYQQNAGDENPPGSFASYSALLDRIDQTAAVDLRWKALPETTGVLGYQFEDLDYTSPEYIIYPGTNPLTGAPTLGYRSDSRNQISDFVYVGADQSFSPNLNASLRIGGQLIDYYNQGTTEFSPYVDGSVTYQYMPQSTAQLGLRSGHNSTDVAGTVGTTPVLDEDTTTIYFNVNHRVNQRFTAAVMGQAQFSQYNGGGPQFNGLEEDLYLLNLNLAYHFTPWLTGETGYSYTKLNSQLPDRAYTRNQIYLGVRATY